MDGNGPQYNGRKLDPYLFTFIPVHFRFLLSEYDEFPLTTARFTGSR